jgi:hypothetical protein
MSRRSGSWATLDQRPNEINHLPDQFGQFIERYLDLTKVDAITRGFQERHPTLRQLATHDVLVGVFNAMTETANLLDQHGVDLWQGSERIQAQRPDIQDRPGNRADAVF